VAFFSLLFGLDLVWELEGGKFFGFLLSQKLQCKPYWIVKERNFYFTWEFFTKICWRDTIYPSYRSKCIKYFPKDWNLQYSNHFVNWLFCFPNKNVPWHFSSRCLISLPVNLWHWYAEPILQNIRAYFQIVCLVEVRQ